MSAPQQQDCHKTSPIPPSYPVQPFQSTYPSNSLPGAGVTSSTPSGVMVASHSGQRSRVCRLKLRHPMFKVGVALLLLSTPIFIVGYFLPAWVASSGLWVTCVDRKCFSTSLPADWLTAVRATESFALICLLFSVVVEVYQDVCRSPPLTESKAVEILAFLAAVFGFTGLVFFAVKVAEAQERSNRYSHVKLNIEFHLSWGFGFTGFSCGLVMLAAILIACSRCRHVALTDSAMAAAGIPLLSSQTPEPATAPPEMTMMPPPYPQGGQVLAPPPPPYPQYQAGGPPFAAQGTPVAQSSLPPGVTSGAPSFYVMSHGKMVPVYADVPPPVSVAIDAQEAVDPEKQKGEV